MAIGATASTGAVTINGNIIATTNQNLNFRGTGSPAVTLQNGTIGGSGAGNITINNLRSSGGSVTISSALGAKVANVYQGSTAAANSGVGSAASQLTLSGANASFVGVST